MKVFVRILVLLLVYLLTTLGSFGIITYLYNVVVLSNLQYQLYIGIGASVLALIFGMLLVLVKGKNGEEQTLIFEEEGDENVDFDEIQTASVQIKAPQKPAEESKPVVTVTQQPAPKEETAEVNHEEVPKEITDDLTMVMDKIVDEDEQTLPNDIDEPWNREEGNDKVEVSAVRIPKVELVSPFGSGKTEEKDELEETAAPLIDKMLEIEETQPLHLNIEEVESEVSEAAENTETAEIPVEDVVLEVARPDLIVEPVADYTEQIAEFQPQDVVQQDEEIVEEIEEPQQEQEPVMEPLPQQEEKVSDFTSSTYIDEEGRPQFRITNQYNTNEFNEQDVIDDSYEKRATRSDQAHDILGKIVGFLAVAAAIALIYFLYTKLLG